jgi:hypothetical protein
MTTFLQTFSDEGIFGPACSGPPFILQYLLRVLPPLQFRRPLPSKTSDLLLPVLSHVAPLPFSLINSSLHPFWLLHSDSHLLQFF